MKFRAIVTDLRTLRFDLGTRESLHSFIASLNPGQIVEVEISKPKAKRSPSQLAMSWAVLMPAAKAALDEAGWDVDGVPLCPEQVKQILYHFCSAVGEDGEHVPLSKQTIAQNCAFFERCCAWLAKRFGVVVPEPCKNWRKHEKAKKKS